MAQAIEIDAVGDGAGYDGAAQQNTGNTSDLSQHVDIVSITTTFLLPCLSSADSNMYLRARALWCLSHYSPYLVQKPDQSALISHILEQLVSALDTNNHIVVRLFAAKAFGFMSQAIPSEVLSPYLVKAMVFVCQLIEHTSADTLHTLLDAVVVSLQINKDITAQLAPQLSPLLIATWSKNATDRIVSITIIEIFETLLTIPSCLASVQEHTIPTIMQIVANQGNLYSGTVGNALDLLKIIVTACGTHNQPPPSEFFNNLVTILTQLITTCDDHSVIDSAVMCLTSFLAVCDANAGSDSTLQAVCSILPRLLDPEHVEDEAAAAVGGLATQLIFRLGSRLGQQNIDQLVQALLVRLFSAEQADLQISVLLVFARLINSMGDVHQFIQYMMAMGELTVKTKTRVYPAATPETPYPMSQVVFGQDKVHALPGLLKKWIELQDGGVVSRSTYPTKVTLSALSPLALASMTSSDISSMMLQIPVRGYPVVNDSDSGVKTRRSARLANKDTGLSYTDMALPVKVVALMLREWKDRNAPEQEPKLSFGGGFGGDDDFADDGDDFDFGGMGMGGDVDDDAMLQLMFGGGGGGGGGGEEYITLSDALGLNMKEMNAHHEVNFDIFPEARTDPINKIDLNAFIWEWIHQLNGVQQQHTLQSLNGNNGASLIQTIAAQLNQEDQETLKAVLESEKPQPKE